MNYRSLVYWLVIAKEKANINIAEITDRLKTPTRACCKKVIACGFWSSTVDVLISLSLLISPLSVEL